ncbi:hypothetical protein HIM_07187 [Hirsutella minnesotensis 3608]|uniref:Mannose-6-phosphate isomerase cupin domain-containing protein n=1 Tax=Hirsutella minnesotensis 3608 TaxID=1043627 RepID=A0A0F7ZTM9_9HYPO|nr:hypothetical protein HIM_07187 [Hirsutella minnesotensis 3608]
MAPILLPPNQPEDAMYAGGAQITSFRSCAPCSSHQPEDWVASTTCGHGSNGVGYTRLPDGRLLRDAVTSSPDTWLGADHVAKFGPDTKLLVKLLDAGQRLPVHAHPHRDWAAKHLGAKHGKAEAWYVMTPGSVWFGLREGMERDELLSLVTAGRGTEVLARMHKIDVEPHQTIYVPPGVLHCLGEGVMVVEVQEPEDMSVLCEWADFNIDGEKHGHLGLGFETALTAVETKARSADDMAKLIKDAKPSDSVYPDASREYFELERRKIDGRGRLRRGFAIVIVIEGNASMTVEGADKLTLKRGSTVVVPHADGDFTLEGNIDVLVARPPQ